MPRNPNRPIETPDLDPTRLQDPIWRLHNLYHVKNPEGKIVKFVPTPEQDDVIDAIYKEGLTKIVILKARQLGMSTVIDLILLDKAVWEKGIQAAIVDLTQGDASKKLENKVKLAWNKLPRDLRGLFKIGKDSGKQFQIQLHSNPEDGWNEIQAGMNARGDTFQVLHICLHPDTNVVMKDGATKPIKSIVPGDYVLNMKGSFSEVRHNQRNLASSIPFPLLQVDVFGTHAPLRVTGNHEVWARTKHGEGTQGEWKPANQLNPGDYIGFPKRNPSQRNVPYAGKPTKLTKYHGWIVGMFLAEGSLRQRSATALELRFALHQDEVPSMIHCLVSKLNVDDCTINVTPNKESKASVVYPNNKDLALFLSKHFMRDGDKILPDKVVKWGREFLDGLVKGYFDGDGSYLNPNEVSVTSTRKHLLISLKRLLLDLRVGCPSIYFTPSNKNYGRNNADCYVLKLMGPANWKFREYYRLPLPEVNTWAGQFRITTGNRPDGRKYWRRGKDHYWFQVKSVKPTPTGELPEFVHDLCLDTPDHSYVTEQGIVHNSEWGAIQHEDEQRSVEILTGALPAAKSGLVIVETTWKGGKGGPLWEIVSNSMSTSPEDMTDQDFTLFFFPWFTDSRYHLTGNYSQITDECNDYLDRVEEEADTTLSDEQRLWYYKVAMSKGFYRFREYPSTLEECFKGRIEGAIYQELMLKAHAEGRIADFPHDQTNLVHTFWDLGSPQNTAVWFVQFVGREIHFIDIICEENLTLADRIGVITSKPYAYGNHYLPHDALAKERAGHNFADQATRIGLQNLVVLPKPHSIWPGINHAQQIFNRFHFHKSKCERGVAALEAYRTKRDKANDYQTDTPVHDWTSHICDPVRILAEADMADMFGSREQGVVASRKRRRRSLARVF